MNKDSDRKEEISKIVNMEFSIMPRYLICIDRLKNRDFEGRLYCGCIPEGKPFNCAERLLISIDEIMDKVGLPQSTVDKKTFIKKDKKTAEASNHEIGTMEVQELMKSYDTKSGKGEKATFVVQVQFRQNASWQGTVKSVETEETYAFRSALELIKIIDTISAKGGTVDTGGFILPKAATDSEDDSEEK